jgi:methionyl-tRNA synthetase
MREVPFGNDGDFSKTQLNNRINSDLANSYGNLFQRVVSMICKNCNKTIPQKPEFLNKEDLVLVNSLKDNIDDYRNLIDNQKFDQFLKNIWLVISSANKYTDEQAPWSLKKTDFKRMEVVLFTLIETLRQISILLQPFLPNTTKSVLDQIKIPLNERNFKHLENIYKGEEKIELPEPLFPRVQ